MSSDVALIPTKLAFPSSAQPVLVREQVLQIIDENFGKRLHVICAGPGYGKTELISSWVKGAPCKTVWYTIDSYDSDEGIFAAHLLAGLQQTCPEISWAGPITEIDTTSRHRLVGQIVTQLQASAQPLTIVLDNFHEIEDDSPTLGFIDLLLCYAPSQLHFTITTRKTPPLRQISRLQSQGEVLVLSSSDLAFTTTEIQDLYQLHSDTPLSLAVAEQLEKHTFGWPLSVHLTLKSLGNGQKTLDANTIDRQLTDYIRSEVLSQHPDRIKDFFKEIAIFNTLTPKTIADVLKYEDTPALLAYLQQHNLFISSISDQSEIYVYPPQLRKLLQQNLSVESRSRYLQLHSQAAHHFKDSGQLQEALEHYQQAEDWDATINLLEGLTEEMLNGQPLGKLHKWLQCLTPPAHLSNPKFLLYQAQLQARVGQPGESLILLGEARQVFSQSHYPRYEVLMLALMGLIHAQAADYSTAGRLLQQIYQISSKEIPFPPDLDLLSSLLMAVADGIPAATHMSKKALYHYEIQADLYGQAQAMIHLASLAIDTGQMTKANTLLVQSSEIIEQLDRPAYLDILQATMAARRFWLAGDLTAAEEILTEHEPIVQQQAVAAIYSIKFQHIQGAIYCDQGRWQQAATRFECALALAEEQAWALKPAIIESQAWLQFRRGDLPGAYEAAQEAHTLVMAENVRQEARVRMLLGALERERGQYQEALFHLKAAHAAFEALDLKTGLWSTLLHLTQTYYDLGYSQQATETLSQALHFARTHNLKGALCWHPKLVAQLCMKAIAQGIEVEYATYLAIKLVEFLSIDELLVLKDVDKPQICLPCIHLLQEMGGAEAHRQLEAITATARLPQIKDQAEKAMAQLPSPAPTVNAQAIRIYCLGNLRVERSGQPIEGATWAGKSKAGRQKVKTLLAYLVERGSHGATKDELIEALWGAKAWGRDDNRLESSLARTLSALRHVLEPNLVPPATSSFILNEEGRYVLNTALCWIDGNIFQDLIREARNAKLKGDSESAHAAYTQALALYRAEYLRDIPGAEEWAGIQRYVLGQQLGVAFMSLADFYLERQDTPKALAFLQKAIKQEPTNHTAHYMLIDVLKREGRFEDATLAYQRCRKIFNQEIDEDPPEAIMELYESIRLQSARSTKQSSHSSVTQHRVRLPALR